MMRILCIIPQLGPGGAERVMATLVNSLSSRHTVRLLTWENPGAEPFYPIATSAELVQAGLFGGRGFERLITIVKRFVLIRRQVRVWRPDIVLSFLDTTNVTTIVACMGMGVPVLVSERVDPTGHYVGRVFKLARRLSYPLATRLIVQTRRVARYFPESMQSRINILYNPIAQPMLTARPAVSGPDGRYRIIGVGRLEWQKGFDRLISAFALVAEKFPLWDLYIFGEGSQRTALTDQIESFGLGHRVKLVGLTSAIHKELAASHIFAFPSRYEGFPNALGEALRSGLPAVGFDQVSGVEEMIFHEQTGYLVPSNGGPGAFGAALCQLMSDESLRKCFGGASAKAGARWDDEVILSQWESLLNEVKMGVGNIPKRGAI